MNIEVYDAVRDVEQWRACLDALPDKLCDIYFHPDYQHLFCTDLGSEAKMFVYQHNAHRWMNAFILRPASAWNDGQDMDIETAYGYGGPVSTTQDAAFLSHAQSAYETWLQENHVVAEFVRFHPLLQNEVFASPASSVEPNGYTLSLDLTTSPAFKGRALNSCKRAWSEGVSVQVVSAASHIEQFASMYWKNMEVVGADPFYHFDAEHFAQLAKLVDQHGFLLVAVHNGQWLAASMFLQGKQYLHYHLSAADFASRIPGSVNVILHAAAVRGHEAGLQALHLGGGRTRAADDSLFFFKQSMSTHQHVCFIGKRVVNDTRYEALCAAWREQESPEWIARYQSRILCYRYRSEACM